MKMDREGLLKLRNKEKYELINAGKYLDVFVNDSCSLVREKVARQGYGLDKLVDDEDLNVRLVARKMIEKVKESEEMNNEQRGII